ncbi:MAG: class I SAM-dependent methyltransferase [Acidimicrobiales bacterium]|nr:class I SAM-dependent methyltransferase [Acidimicrobiales bacterium]
MHDPARYGDAFADVYDEWYGALFDTDAAVEALAALAGAGPVVELGVGTGRLAVPLAARGLTVIGVDASAAMLERLAAKPGGGRVHPLLADMSDLFGETAPAARDARLGPDAVGAFRLVFAAYNTFFNLDSEEAQRRCLDQCARLLAPGGGLAIEAFVPADGDVPRTSLDVRSVTADGVVLTATEHTADTQTITGQHVEITAAGVRLRPWSVRYLTPAQLDALAGEAGLARAERWGGWDGRPFDEDSDTHVTVYRPAAT